MNFPPSFLYTPYSFSKQETYYSCPYKFKLTYIDKIKVNISNIALEKGSFVHLFLEHEMNPTEKTNNELKNFKFYLHDSEQIDELFKFIKTLKETEFFKKLKKSSQSATFFTEQGFSFDLAWTPDNNYKRTKDILISGYIDLMVVKDDLGIVVDYKTGKPKGKYQTYEQTELYALFMFKYFKVSKVKALYYYVEHDTYVSKEYSIIEMQTLQNKFDDLLIKIEKTKDFTKNITKLCGWCDFQKQGHCHLTDEEMLRVL